MSLQELNSCIGSLNMLDSALVYRPMDLLVLGALVLCFCTLKRSKISRLSFLVIIGAAGKPTHFESLNSDKIRPR